MFYRVSAISFHNVNNSLSPTCFLSLCVCVCTCMCEYKAALLNAWSMQVRWRSRAFLNPALLWVCAGGRLIWKHRVNFNNRHHVSNYLPDKRTQNKRPLRKCHILPDLILLCFNAKLTEDRYSNPTHGDCSAGHRTDRNCLVWNLCREFYTNPETVMHS